MNTDETQSPDFYTMIARERGAPDGWQWSMLDRKGEKPHAATLVRGGVPGPAFKSGPRKGRPNWSKSTAMAEFVITDAEYDARRAQWEQETGRCSNCGGCGVETAGWSVATGTMKRKCRRCNGSGKAVPQKAAS